MGGFRGVAALCCVALALSSTGCTEEREITPEQVAAWNAEAADLFPNLDVEITGSSNATMLGTVNSITVDVVFNDYEDLTSTEAQFAEFVDSMKDAGYGENFPITGHAAERSRARALATALDTQAKRQTHDAVSAEAGLSYHFDQAGHWVRYFYLHIDLADPSKLTLDRLQQDVGIASGLADQVTPDKVSVTYFDASDTDVHGDPLTLGPKISDTITDAADGDCLRVDDWALELGSFFVSVYPADDPQGACA